MKRRLSLLTMLISIAAAAAGAEVASQPSAFNLEQRKATQWAWQPIKDVSPPSVRDPNWARQPIDRFILARLEEKGLHPAGPADKRTLIRRAYFDLVGLPPTPEAIDAFLHDDSPDAFAKVVDGLLASPHFGERWARHWMDLARYAETYGHEFDYSIANAWRYRDYLIRAFNADVPYNQFVIEQIAGDLLPNPRINPTDGTNESILGTGFWWFGEQTHSPVDVRQHQADWMDNQIDVLGKTFLGMTLACARCHDHKFDPVAQKDYYSLMGMLESSCRQDAMLDPHGSIAAIHQKIEALHADADTALADGLPRGGPAFRKQMIAKLMSGITLEDERSRQPSSPMYAWGMLASAGPEEFDAKREHAVTDLGAEQQRADESRKESELFKSFSDGTYGDWLPTGWAFENRPTQPGQWDAQLGGGRFLAPGLAHTGAVAGAFRGVLRSPTFTLTHPEILYHLAGRNCQVRLIIDGYRMDQFNGLLFGGAQFPVETDGKFVWHRQAQDVSRYIGHAAHIELIDNGDGWLAVDEIRFADKGAALPSDEPSATSKAILEDSTVTSKESLAAAYAAHLSDALDRYHERTLDQRDSDLLIWAVNHDLVTIDPAHRSKLDELKGQCDELARQVPAPEYAVAMCDGSGLDEHVFGRGNYRTLGPAAPRGFLTALDGPNPVPISHGSGRLELARRLVEPSNPLVSRVIVNRIWHHLFGRGIVASVDNLGVMGSPPSHPKLLDYLATQFMRDGWSIKKTIRAIMLSSTYQMSSQANDPAAEQADPDNVLLHRASIRRLEAEPIRDAILAVSGRLEDQVGGPSVNVFLTPFMEGRGRPSSGPLDGAGRRSIYLAIRRNFLSPMMLAFDMPIPFNAMGRRSVSNVPAQALILMNDPFVVEQSARWARKTLDDPHLSPRQRVDRMYVAAFGRPARDGEFQRIEAFMDQQGQELNIPAAERITDVRLWTDLAHALFNTKEFIFLN